MFWKAAIAQSQEALLQGKRQAKLTGDRQNRRLLAEQANAVLSGKEQWQPTWQQLPSDVRVMKGLVDAPVKTSLPSGRPRL